MADELRRVQRLDRNTISQMAAGEMVERPINAVKELLENSLDAGAKLIQITVKSGGVDFLQIKDDGHGIHKDDLLLACERHATSKLRQFNDLKQIGTYGFRGEALASIAAIARRMTVTSRTAQSPCGFRITYEDGVTKQKAAEPIAANQGTIIAIDDLFANNPMRRTCLRSASEEFSAISNLVMKYALHSSGRCGFRLSKMASNKSLDVSMSGSGKQVYTLKESKCVENLELLWSKQVADGVVPFCTLQEEPFKFSASGFLSKISLHLPVFHFVLFINNRLVDCPPLKRAIALVYSQWLSKGSHPFVYMSLHLAPEMIDVNIHPAKTEVLLLEQEEIISLVTRAIEEKVKTIGSESAPQVIPSISCYTRSEAPAAALADVLRLEDSSPDLLHDDLSLLNDTANGLAGSQKISDGVRIEFVSASTLLNQKEDLDQCSSSSQPKKLIQTKLLPDASPYNGPPKELRPSKKIRSDHFQPKLTEIFERQNHEPSVTGSAGDGPMTASEATSPMQRRPMTLVSVKELRKDIANSTDEELKTMIRNSLYIGVPDHHHVFVQYDTKLVMLQLWPVMEELCYQMFLIEFGNFRRLQFGRPLPIVDLIKIHLEELPEYCDKGEEFIRLASVEATEKLIQFSAMLDDYFGITIKNPESKPASSDEICDRNNELAVTPVERCHSPPLTEPLNPESVVITTLPILIAGYQPEFGHLPEFVYNCTSQVNWDEEKDCFHTFGRALARFYAQPPLLGRDNDDQPDKGVDNGDDEVTKEMKEAGDKEEVDEKWRQTVEMNLFPELKKTLSPVRQLADNESIRILTSTEHLYRMFERC